MIIEILEDITIHPDMGTKNEPWRQITFRVRGELTEHVVMGRTLEELKKNARAILKGKVVLATMEV